MSKPANNRASHAPGTMSYDLLMDWIKAVGVFARQNRGRPLCRSGANEKAVWMHLEHTVPSARPAKLDGWWYCIDEECDRVIGRA